MARYTIGDYISVPIKGNTSECREIVNIKRPPETEGIAYILDDERFIYEADVIGPCEILTRI